MDRCGLSRFWLPKRPNHITPAPGAIPRRHLLARFGGMLSAPHLDRLAASDHDSVNLAEKQAVLHDAGDGIDRSGDLNWPKALAEGCIQDVIALVCEEWFSLDRAKPHTGSKVGKMRSNELAREGHDFDRQRKLAEPSNDFACVYDHDHPARSGSHDLLSEQGAATAFDRLKVAIDLVGAVDREVYRTELLKRNERHRETTSEHFGRSGGGDSGDAKALPNAVAQALNGIRCCASGPKSNEHAVFDLVDRSSCSQPLLCFSVRHLTPLHLAGMRAITRSIMKPGGANLILHADIASLTCSQQTDRSMRGAYIMWMV